MINLPKRNSLVSQTAIVLREEIDRGGWSEWLPSERTLCESLQVSRNTLRAALEQLKREGIVDSKQGAGNRIHSRAKARGRALRSRDVAVLTPDSLEQLRPTQTLWIEEMRGMLSERDCRLHFFHGRQYFRTNPGPALHKLVRQSPHACWILMLANEKTQRWFEENQVPCVVAGSVSAGLNLPFRDLDHRAICRHAAGVMLTLGHRRLALLIQKSNRAGDLESEAGFIEGVRQSRHLDAEVVVGYHNGTVAGICLALRRLMERKPAPTALLAANAYHYLAVVSRLAQLGWRVPQDVSVVSRDEDPFLSFMVPTPTRYAASPHTMAKTLIRPMLEVLEGGAVTHRSVRIMPEFIRGETLGAPRS